MMSRTGIVQDKLVKHLHEKTECYYDLFDVAPFPSARSWEISGFPTGLFQRGSCWLPIQEAYQASHSDNSTQSGMFDIVSGTPQMESCIVDKDPLVRRKALSSAHGWWKISSGGNHMSPVPPATSSKPFQLAGVLWWCRRAFRVISSRIWSHFEAILLSQDGRRTSWKPLSTLTLITMRPVCMDDNVRPHRTRALMDFYSEMQSLPRFIHTHTHTHTHTLSYRQKCTFHGLYYSRGALAGTRNRSMSPSWGIDPSIHRTISRRSNTELHLSHWSIEL